MLLTFNSIQIYLYITKTQQSACSINLNTLLKFIEQSVPSTSSSIKKKTQDAMTLLQKQRLKKPLSPKSNLGTFYVLLLIHLCCFSII